MARAVLLQPPRSPVKRRAWRTVIRSPFDSDVTVASEAHSTWPSLDAVELADALELARLLADASARAEARDGAGLLARLFTVASDVA